MIEEINIWKELKALRIGVVVRSLIAMYVDWERMWYDPKNNFTKGDKVKLNWKYRYHFNKKDNRVFVFDKIDQDNVVDMADGEVYNLYWLTSA
tara:strand:- start:240 stop:518 length:279 start_codon:yes stop_codon:yes gene_type:complete